MTSSWRRSLRGLLALLLLLLLLLWLPTEPAEPVELVDSRLGLFRRGAGCRISSDAFWPEELMPSILFTTSNNKRHNWLLSKTSTCFKQRELGYLLERRATFTFGSERLSAVQQLLGAAGFDFRFTILKIPPVPGPFFGGSFSSLPLPACHCT